jgi:hypothetical protein
MAKSRKCEFLCSATGKTSDGKTKSFQVIREGGLIKILGPVRAGGLKIHIHYCPASVRGTEEEIKRQIQIVWTDVTEVNVSNPPIRGRRS